jgi:hypothetical protein
VRLLGMDVGTKNRMFGEYQIAAIQTEKYLLNILNIIIGNVK